MFRPIALSDKEWMDRCRREFGNDMTVISFPAVYTWKSTFGLTIDGDDSFYVIKSEADQGYYYPAGSRDACRRWVLSMLPSGSRLKAAAGRIELSDPPAASDTPLKFVYVPESELGWLEELGFTISCEPDTSEYVYSSHSLALEDNRSGTNYRVKIRHFSRETSWSAQSMSFPEDTDLLRKMTELWDQSVQRSHPEDRLATLTCAEDPAAIGLSGVRIETADGEWAFLLGYPSTDQIYDMTIVKYSRNISRNAVPVCICEMAKRVCGAFPYINLEDDLGDPGLRFMKKLYHPLFLLDSYSAFW